MRRLWIDTDLALGAPRGDVDDGFALAAVLASPGVELLGVSTVFGNTSASAAARASRALLDQADRRCEVVEGAAGPGRDSAAARAIAGLPEGTDLLALGPLTNLAAALRRDPALASRLTVYAVGGNLGSWGRFPPYWPFEFNLAKDPAAAAAVFAAPPLRRRLYPLDLCRHLSVGVRELRRLAACGPLGSYLVRSSWRWLAYAPLRYQRLRFPLWDLVPALDLLGLASVAGEMRALRIRGRGGLVDGGEVSWWGRRFEPAAAWAAFLGALREVPRRTAT